MDKLDFPALLGPLEHEEIDRWLPPSIWHQIMFDPNHPKGLELYLNPNCQYAEPVRANWRIAWRGGFAGWICPFTEQAALIYGLLMGEAVRAGFRLSAPDGMIVAITKANRGRLATRNIRDFSALPIDLINPWE